MAQALLAAGASVDLQDNGGARALELMGAASGGMRRGGRRV